MAAPQLAYLFKKVLDKTASFEERSALELLLLDPENEADIKILLDEAFKGVKVEKKMNEESAAQILEVIRSLDNAASEIPVIPLKKKRFRWAVAVAAAVVIGACWWLILPFINTGNKTIVEVKAPADIPAPSGTQAILTLSSGEKILLDSIGSGKLTAEKGVQIAKGDDGRIVYSGGDQKVVFNTISLPRGSRPLQLVLSDGTITWLNAASSITYPTSFTGGKRQVTMEGEAYFEVSHHPLKPFVVQSATTLVEVLGTHFNIKGYPDEPSTDITLTEGSVKVSQKDHENAGVVLQPGEQAVVAENIQLIKDADTDAALAWKNGYFSLRGADLQSIMRQISRWYNVEVLYEGNFSERKFVGAISRDISLNDLLQSLQEYGIEGRLENQKLLLQMKEK